jgi:hypothetical protein
MIVTWPKSPIEVVQGFVARNQRAADPGPGALWAAWAVEGLGYLDDLDQQEVSYPAPVGSHNSEVVDINHVRWATGNAITALDLCAATLGRLYCPSGSAHELDLRDFTPTRGKNKDVVKAHRDALPQAMRGWVDQTRADPRYKTIHGARNPFTHAWMNRNLQRGTSGHKARTGFRIKYGQTEEVHNARDLVELSQGLAFDRVSAFFAVLDQL